MSENYEFPADEPALPFDEVADILGIPKSKVGDMVRERKLIAIRREKQKLIPAAFFGDKGLNRFVPGVIALLSDGGYSADEILRYLFTADDSLPGRPIDALFGHRAREVMRRAQAMAF